MRKVALLSTSNEKLPSKSVIVPLLVPFSIIFAPIIVSPPESTIVPVIVFLFVCLVSVSSVALLTSTFGDSIICFPLTS